MGRYLRDTLVLHDGTARALRIPLTHNAPGFSEGIAGPDLIERMSKHAQDYGARIEEAHIVDIGKEEKQFTVTADDGRTWTSRTVILATGLLLNQIELDPELHKAAIDAAVLRYCPVCDAYEHRDKRIGIIGCDSQGAAEALFLRQYTKDLTLIPQNFADLSPKDSAAMAEAGVKVIEQAVAGYEVDEKAMRVTLEDGATLVFDVIYPALGVRPRTELAEKLGLTINENGCVDAEALAGKCVDGFYCVGDIVEGLDQIGVSMGHGAVAATNAHNWLRDQDGHSL